MVTQLLRADEARNSAFDRALHGKSANSQGGVKAMLGKNSKAHAAATQEYFQHWDKTAGEEDEAVRQARKDDYASLTRQYVSSVRSTDLTH